MRPVTEKASQPSTPSSEEPVKPLPPAAVRALEEARLRREQAAPGLPRTEVGGPEGPEPTRYGDWEVKGIVSDF